MSELFDKMPTGMMDDAIEIHNLRAEVSRLTAERDALQKKLQANALQAISDAGQFDDLAAERDALRAALAEFYEAWPGGLDEIESSVSEWRARAIRHEHRLTAAGIPFDNPIHPQLLADCDADGYLIDAALKDAP